MQSKRSPAFNHPFKRAQNLVVEGWEGVWRYYSKAGKHRVYLEPSDRIAKRVAELYPYGMIVVSVQNCTPHPKR